MLLGMAGALLLAVPVLGQPSTLANIAASTAGRNP
jgi:hypothetical protein